MSAGCDECTAFAEQVGHIVRRIWEIKLDEKYNVHTKRFLLNDNKKWMLLCHQAWLAHQFERHAT